ncbi:MAG: hypothetical protein ACYC56_05945, partial [Candidatus Aquicultor sp.]
DFMRSKVESRIGKLADSEQITSENIKDTPIFTVKVEGPDRRRIRGIAAITVEELRTYINKEQRREQTPREDRIVMRQIGVPTTPRSSQSFQSIKLSLAFLSPVLLAIMLAFMVENIDRPGSKRSSK